MHTKIDKIEIMIGHETDKIIEELFESLLQRYQEGLEKSTRGSEFIFAGVDVLYYILSKLSPNPRDVIYRFLVLCRDWKEKYAQGQSWAAVVEINKLLN